MAGVARGPVELRDAHGAARRVDEVASGALQACNARPLARVCTHAAAQPPQLAYHVALPAGNALSPRLAPHPRQLEAVLAVAGLEQEARRLLAGGHDGRGRRGRRGRPAGNGDRDVDARRCVRNPTVVRRNQPLLRRGAAQVAQVEASASSMAR